MLATSYILFVVILTQHFEAFPPVIRYKGTLPRRMILPSADSAE